MTTNARLALAASLRQFAAAAGDVLSALERAERESSRAAPDVADVFARFYPFADSFDEVVGQIAEWRDDVAEGLGVKGRQPKGRE